VLTERIDTLTSNGVVAPLPVMGTFEIRDGKMHRHREYWNPLVTIDAIGGRDEWAAGFGFPEEPGA